MAKKTDTKKTKRKPTQLDRIEGIIRNARDLQLDYAKEVRDELYRHIAECHRDLTNRIEAKLLPPSPPAVVEEPWVPKVGDVVVCIDATEKTTIRDGMIGAVNKAWGAYIDIDGFPLGGWDYKRFRPATSEEVLAYKEGLERSKKEAEWAKVTELQPNDGCLVDPDFLREMRMLELPSYARPLDSDRECEYLEWDQGKLYRCRYLPGKPSPIPNTEFLRRARGTAARLKEEARKAEEAKPLEFGMPVKFVDPLFGDSPPVEGGYYIGRTGGEIHLIAYKHQNDPSMMCTHHAHRSEFTIKS